MSASDTFENSILLLVYNNVPFATIGDAIGLRDSSTAGSLYVGLHTADPGDAGTQATSEATFGSYARVAVVRSAAGWTVTADTVSNAAAINFPTCTSGSNTITYFSVGSEAAGNNTLLFSGALDSSLVVSSGITASFGIGGLTVTAA